MNVYAQAVFTCETAARIQRLRHAMRLRWRACKARVECGGLPPLYSGEACLVRSEE